MDNRQNRLKLAVQKSGRLTDHSLDILGRCGLKISRGKDQLIAYGENLPLDLLFVRDDDIPDLVQEDVCDLGLVGLNVLGFEPSGGLMVMLILGGVGRIYGAFVGPLVYLIAQDLLAKQFPEYWFYFLGLIFILSTLFLPNGVVGLVRSWRKK